MEGDGIGNFEASARGKSSSLEGVQREEEIGTFPEVRFPARVRVLTRLCHATTDGVIGTRLPPSPWAHLRRLCLRETQAHPSDFHRKHC